MRVVTYVRINVVHVRYIINCEFILTNLVVPCVRTRVHLRN